MNAVVSMDFESIQQKDEASWLFMGISGEEVFERDERLDFLVILYKAVGYEIF